MYATHKLEVSYDDIFKKWVVYTYKISLKTGDFIKVSVKHFETDLEAIAYAKNKKKKYHCPINLYNKTGYHIKDLWLSGVHYSWIP